MLKIGDILEGTVTGIQSYGVFVQLDEDHQGLVHISEIKHGFVSNLEEIVKIGQTIKVQIIDIDEYTHTISLSMRSLIALNIPPYPARVKRRRRRYLPNIGFKSVEEQLPQWMDEAMAVINCDQFDIKQKV